MGPYQAESALTFGMTLHPCTLQMGYTETHL